MVLKPTRFQLNMHCKRKHVVRYIYIPPTYSLKKVVRKMFLSLNESKKKDQNCTRQEINNKKNTRQDKRKYILH